MENANEHARFLRAGLALQNHISVQHRNTSVWSRHAWMLSNCCCLLSPQNLWLPQVAANYMDFLVPGLVLGTGIRIQGITWVTSYWQQIAEELFYDLERAIVRGFLLFQPYLLSRWHLSEKALRCWGFTGREKPELSPVHGASWSKVAVKVTV